MLQGSSGPYRAACPVCLGDMAEDEQEDGWLVCLICARSFPAAEIEALGEPRNSRLTFTPPPSLPGAA